MEEKKSRITEELQRDKSFTVSYLIQSVGLSPESAIRARVRLQNPETPDSILALLNRYGLNAKQIDCAVRRTPGILKCKEQDIVPKLEFFLSRGASKELLGAMVAKDSFWLMRRLDDKTIPIYKFIKSILLTDKRAIQTIKSNLWLLQRDLERLYSPNIKVLEELKVPESSIRYLVGFYPEAVFCGGEFKETVSEVLEMGFNPLKITFVLALHAVSGNVNKAIRDRCYEIYSKWGWSKEDICMAFRKNPNCMLMSQKKLEGILEFLVHKMGYEAKIIAQNAAIMNQSLEKRIIPRFSVIQVLLSEGLICKQPKIPTVLAHNDELFLRRFVVPYEKIIPQLHDIYKGKIKLVEVDLDEG